MNEEIKKKLEEVIIRQLEFLLSNKKFVGGIALAKLIELYMGIKQDKLEQFQLILTKLNEDQN